jgi:hypothetical protein
LNFELEELSCTMPKNSNKPWTSDDDRRLLEAKAEAIGVMLGRSTGSIVGRLGLLGTRSKKSGDAGDDGS